MTEYQEVKPKVEIPVSLAALGKEDLEIALRRYPYAAGAFIAQALKLHDVEDVGFTEALGQAAARTISRAHLKFLLEGPMSLQFEWRTSEHSPESEGGIEEKSNPETENEESKEDFESVEDVDLQLVENEDENQPIATQEAQSDEPVSEEGAAEYSRQWEERWEENEASPEIITHPAEAVSGDTGPELPALPELPKVNGFGFAFVRTKGGKKKPSVKPEPFDIQAVSGKRPIKPRKGADAVIDKFLETTPSISSPRIDFGGTASQPDLSIASTLLDEEIVTENMALIYLKQRNFERALEIYRRLQLKFPEKSAFFAALIKNIENTIV